MTGLQAWERQAPDQPAKIVAARPTIAATTRQPGSPPRHDILTADPGCRAVAAVVGLAATILAGWSGACRSQACSPVISARSSQPGHLSSADRSPTVRRPSRSKDSFAVRDAAQTVLAWDLKSSSSRSVLLTSCFFAGRADLEQKQTKGTKGRRGNRRGLSSPKPRAQELFSSFPSVPWGLRPAAALGC